MELANQIIFLGSALLIVSIIAGVLSSRIGAPLLLVFLALGMVAGEDGLGIQFNNFGAAYLLGSLSLAVILFDGGLRTPLRSIRIAWAPASVMATIGVVVTAAITGFAAVWLLDLPWIAGLLTGAIVASTDAAAVFLLLHQRGMELRKRIGATLEVESGVNDPMAVFLTITLVELLVTGGGDVTFTARSDFSRLGPALAYLEANRTDAARSPDLRGATTFEAYVERKLRDQYRDDPQAVERGLAVTRDKISGMLARGDQIPEPQVIRTREQKDRAGQEHLRDGNDHADDHTQDERPSRER